MELKKKFRLIELAIAKDSEAAMKMCSDGEITTSEYLQFSDMIDADNLEAMKQEVLKELGVETEDATHKEQVSEEKVETEAPNNQNAINEEISNGDIEVELNQGIDEYIENDEQDIALSEIGGIPYETRSLHKVSDDMAYDTGDVEFGSGDDSKQKGKKKYVVIIVAIAILVALGLGVGMSVSATGS